MDNTWTTLIVQLLSRNTQDDMLDLTTCWYVSLLKKTNDSLVFTTHDPLSPGYNHDVCNHHLHHHQSHRRRNPPRQSLNRIHPHHRRPPPHQGQVPPPCSCCSPRAASPGSWLGRASALMGRSSSWRLPQP